MIHWKLKLFLEKAFKNSISPLFNQIDQEKKKEVTHITSIINERRDITTNDVHSKKKENVILPIVVYPHICNIG